MFHKQFAEKEPGMNDEDEQLAKKNSWHLQRKECWIYQWSEAHGKEYYIYSHEDSDGEGENDGIVSDCSSDLPLEGGWAWAKTTLGKGLDAGIALEIGEGAGDTSGRS